MNENDKLEVLKEILFTDDRAYKEKIAKRIEILENEKVIISQICLKQE